MLPTTSSLRPMKKARLLPTTSTTRMRKMAAAPAETMTAVTGTTPRERSGAPPTSTIRSGWTSTTMMRPVPAGSCSAAPMGTRSAATLPGARRGSTRPGPTRGACGCRTRKKTGRSWICWSTSGAPARRRRGPRARRPPPGGSTRAKNGSCCRCPTRQGCCTHGTSTPTKSPATSANALSSNAKTRQSAATEASTGKPPATGWGLPTTASSRRTTPRPACGPTTRWSSSACRPQPSRCSKAATRPSPAPAAGSTRC
mmetsp:Transcript_33165/g.102398  ORF Transcript_33165/g.102398 Transcript_33165/m.102398 type:complete len:256 (-) Transcript_33165:760-1527(-)